MWIVIKYYFRKGFFLRFLPFIIPSFYNLDFKIEVLIYTLIFILFENSFCKLHIEKYFWDKRINKVTEVKLGWLLKIINGVNALFITLMFIVSLFIKFFFYDSVDNIGRLTIQFLSLMVFSTISGNLLHLSFSKMAPFKGKKVLRFLVFSFSLNLPQIVFFSQYYFQVLFLFLIIFVWHKQIKKFKKYTYCKPCYD